MRKLITLVSFLVVFLFGEPALSLESPEQVTNLRVSGTYPQIGSNFEFEARCLPTKDRQANFVGRQYGITELNSNCQLVSIQGKINGREVKVQPNAFRDIWNPTSLSSGYDSRSKALKLHITGGDGGESYQVILYFVRGVLRFREVPKLNEDGELQMVRETPKG